MIDRNIFKKVGAVLIRNKVDPKVTAEILRLLYGDGSDDFDDSAGPSVLDGSGAGGAKDAALRLRRASGVMEARAAFDAAHGITGRPARNLGM